MKRRILSILLTLCMVLCLAPAVAFAEEDTTPVTNINAIIDEPSEGEHPADNPSVTATPEDSVVCVSASWKRILQEKYNDDKAKAEDWEAITTTDTFVRGYCYSLELRFSPKSGYTFSEQLTGTISGTTAGVQRDGADVILRVTWSTLKAPSNCVTSVNAQITKPVLGTTPDRNPVITANPAGCMTFNNIQWRKVKAEYAETVDWDNLYDMKADEVFEAGYIYFCRIFLDTQGNYEVAGDTIGTINGEPCRDVAGGGVNRVTLVRVYALEHETHVAGTTWKFDDTQHWNPCIYGDDVKFNRADHVSSDWIVERPATAETTGVKVKECTVCGKELESAEIPTTMAGWTSVWSEGFETTTNETLPVGWEAKDEDGDGHSWRTDMDFFRVLNYIEPNTNYAHHGSRFIYSESYDYEKNVELNPNNWLYLPAQTLEAGREYRLTFMASAVDEMDYEEVFGVYISTDDGENKNYTQLGDDYKISKPGQGWDEDTNLSTWEEVSVDLSSYAGKTVSVAIVHYHCTDQFILKLDCFHLWSKTPTHTHVWAEKWESDDAHHWHKCTIEDCDAKGDYSEHSGEDDGNCTTAVDCEICGYQIKNAELAHNYPDKYAPVRPGSTHTRKCQNKGCNIAITNSCVSDGKATCQAFAKCTVCGGGCGTKAEHDYTAETVSKDYLKSAATCTEPAVYYKSCSVCGQADWENTFTFGDPLEHDFGAWSSNGDGTHTRTCSHDKTHTQSGACTGGTATCKDKAVCEICGGSYGTEAADNHVGGTELRGAKAASCTEAGYTGDVYCKGCGAVVSTGADVPATGHSGGTADCQNRVICAVCGERYGEVNPAKHSNLKHVVATAAAKDAPGNIEYWYCSDCEKYFSDAAATGEIAKTATVTEKRNEEKPAAAKTEDGGTSPRTDDESPVTLWLALLFLGGGALVGTGIASKKRARR